MPTLPTSILPDGDINSKPKDVYGNGKILLRIGNGGAGATGLIRFLADDYLSTLNEPRSITWVCNHSRHTQLALHQEFIDIALTYERDQEILAESEGWSTTAGCMFHDHFCLAGPTSDPAGVKVATSLLDAFSRIEKHRALFHSRVDGSATMWREQSFWSQCKLAPWRNNADKVWYKTSRCTPAEALKTADEAGAYLLIDRSTLLAQTGLQTISKTTVFFEPKSTDDALMNSCYALYSPFLNISQSKAVNGFIHYMLSGRGQHMIETYGRDSTGLPLFATLQEGFSKSSLIGGIQKNGKWILPAKL